MKNFLIMAIMACVFVSCSSDGSREIQIDEMNFIPRVSDVTIDECKNVSSVFEVVPGKYELTWKLVKDIPQHQQYDVTLTMKLRLNKTIKVKQKILDEVRNNTNEDNPILNSPFVFYLVDANNETDKSLMFFDIDRDYTTKWVFSKDKAMDFLSFLQSTPGTEVDLVLHSPAYVSDAMGNCVEACKAAKGIVCKIVSDKSFTYDFGDIE